MPPVTRPRTLANLPPLLVWSPDPAESPPEEAEPAEKPLPPMPVNRRGFSFALDPRHGVQDADPRPFAVRSA